MFKISLNPKAILIIILIFTALTRMARLDYPNSYVFDEVYHAFTAKEYVKGSKEAWEWWTQPPPGVAFEWTHPPLAKEIMAVSMLLVKSQDGWAWRLPSVLLGTLSVYLIYLLGKILLKKDEASLIAAFIFSIDGLNFVQSRTGMNDIYFVTFMLASLVFFLRKSFIPSFIIFGLSLASKWAAIYLLPLYILLLLKDRQFIKLIYLIIIPAIVYLLSYVPFFSLGHSPDQFIHLQQQMWWYHTGLKATHGYSSPWWSWPLNLYPVWYFVDYQKDKIANIFASGNPVAFWIGSVTLIFTAWEGIRKKSINLMIIVLGFFVFWLPWALSPRIMFLYHFSPSVPFLTLTLGYQLGLSLGDKRNHRLIVMLIFLMTFSFVLIYPFLTGVLLPREIVDLFFTTNLSKNPF